MFDLNALTVTDFTSQASIILTLRPPPAAIAKTTELPRAAIPPTWALPAPVSRSTSPACLRFLLVLVRRPSTFGDVPAMTQTVDIPAREPLSGTMCRAARPGLKLQLEAFRCGPAFPSHGLSVSPGATSRWSNRGKAASCSRLAPSVRDGIAVPLSKVHTAPGYDSARAEMNSGQAGTSGACHRVLHASGGCTAVTRRTRARGLAHARWGVRSCTRPCENWDSWFAGPTVARIRNHDGPLAVQTARDSQLFRWREGLL